MQNARNLTQPAILKPKVKITRNQLADKDNSLNEIIAHNKKMNELIKYVDQVANLNSNVLILGETGTGKDLFARHIHESSRRKDGVFRTIYCVGMPGELLESQLFTDTHGEFSEGTLFLDEIADLSIELQTKILYFINEANVRIIASSNKNLYEMVKEGSFREDLYNVLNEVQVYIPPLKERLEDIIPLIYYSLNKFNKKYNIKRYISQECLEILCQYTWPGNVRELQNLIERLVVTVEGNKIMSYHLPKYYTNTINKITFIY